MIAQMNGMDTLLRAMTHSKNIFHLLIQILYRFVHNAKHAMPVQWGKRSTFITHILHI